MGGLVVLLTNPSAGLRLPYEVYKGIFFGSGLDWFFHFGHHHIDIPFTHQHVFFWWNTATANNATYNLQQTLILTTTLVFTGLAVSFAFRCGLFNIGGQGQYLVGVITGLWIGTRFPGMNHALHIVFAMVVAAAAGALWSAIAGFLKATTGAHEVISTIMLNWIAYWIGSYVFGQGGPLQGPQKFSPTSAVVVPSAKLPVFWGNAALQGVHIGFFIALAALVSFWFARSASIRKRRVTAASASSGTTCSQWRFPDSSPASRERWTCSVTCTSSASSTCRRRRSASSGSPSPCSAATRPSASVCRRCCSRA